MNLQDFFAADLLFTEFLHEAKQHTYASETSVKTKLPDGREELRFERGEFLYIDTYATSTSEETVPYAGTEIATKNGSWKWMMNYEGEIVQPAAQQLGLSAKEIYAHLRSALRNENPEYPVRGIDPNEDGLLYIVSLDTCDLPGVFHGTESTYAGRDHARKVYRGSFSVLARLT